MDRRETDLRLQAARVGGQAELKDIRTRRLSATLEAPPLPAHRLSFDFHTDLKHGRAEEGFFVEASYTLHAYQRPEASPEADRGDPFAILEFELFAVYDLPIPECGDYENEELGAFTNTTAQFALYPFAREIVHDLTHRLGIPPLTMGTMRLPLEREEVKVRAGANSELGAE